jgi:ubiquinone/menaquinone biosynthesis C-methylase UbiE
MLLVVTILDRALGSSRVYEWSRRAIGAHKEMERLVSDVIRPQPGMRVLDLGCGNGRLVPFLHDSRYVGVDNNDSYIDAARQRYASDTVEFIRGDVSDLDRLDLGTVDAVICIGVLHHLDDETAAVALRSARSVLREGGRIITLDGCYEPNQHSVARVLMALDRGRFVRHPADYERLVGASFDVTSREIWDDVYKFPYTHVVIVGEAGDSRPT